MDRTVPDDRRREPDVVEEAIARAKLPRNYRGTVTYDEEEHYIEVSGWVGKEGPTVNVTVDSEEANEIEVPAGEYPELRESAYELLNALETVAENWGLERED